MKKLSAYSSCLLLTIIAGCGNPGKKNTDLVKIVYPKTEKVAQVDDYFGTKIEDPYRWLEFDTAANVKTWVEAQNKTTRDYLQAIPFRDKIKKRITELVNYPKYFSPFKAGNYFFFSKNDGLQNQSTIWFQEGMNGEPKIFLDPNKMSSDGTAAVDLLDFSKDNRYAPYAINQSGSDWQTIRIIDITTQKELSDKLEWVKFSGAAWKNDGFYYSRYDAPGKGKEYSNINEFHKVYFHKLGDPQEKDALVFEDRKNPQRYLNAQTTEDGRFLLIYASAGTSGTEVYCKDLSTGQKEFSLLFRGFDYDYGILESVGDKLMVKTNDGAPNQRVILVDPKNPARENWKDLIPEKPELMDNASTAGGKLFVTYMKDVATHAYQYDLQGKPEREIMLPGQGEAGGFGGDKNDKELFYTYASFTYPPAVFKYDIASGKSELWRRAEVKFNPDNYETKQVFYQSKDGTKIPMYIVHKKGIELNGNNPTLLYAYGGFNAGMGPSFSASRIALLDAGGIYALANIRGGNEYGEAWHKAGMLLNKQNVFDDFIAAQEYLIKEKYPSSAKLAIQGGSSGGLLIGACMTQRPDLCKVCIPQVGVMDMLRYHKFTVGWGWVVEYGSSDSAKYFNYLRAYSPLHNLKDGVEYPATLITTADHDDRVVPAHSFKFAATLQEKNKSTNPTLIRIESKAGHGAGKPISKVIEEQTDIYSFMLYNMGVEPEYL
ncbi:MAG: prolyl oligopeptidase family serine peptidase [Bacteroidia bacterium]